MAAYATHSTAIISQCMFLEVDDARYVYKPKCVHVMGPLIIVCVHYTY